MNKLIGILVCLLLLTLLYPTALSSSTNTTIYVDDDNTEGPWDGNEGHPFQRIQDAIDVASDGDTIFVFSGIYNESIASDKSLFLIGENRESTIIQGIDTSNLATLFLTGNRSRICGFTIKQGEGKCRTGIYLWHSSNNSISQCTFLMNSSRHPGVRAMEIQHDSCDNTVEDCCIFSKFKGIIIGGKSDGNQIINCDFTIPSVVVEDSVSGDNSIQIWDGCYNNVIANCSITGGDGIIVWGSNTLVSNCIISDTMWNMGFDLAYCSNTTLRNNVLVNASFSFRVNEQDQLFHDIDLSNTINGKPIYYLIQEYNVSVDYSWNVGFLGLAFCRTVTVEGIDSQGIFIGMSRDVEIRNCTIHDAQGASLFNSEQIDISNCSVISSRRGVDINYFSSNISISDCSFAGGIDGVSIDLYCENVFIVHCLATGCQVSGVSIGGKNHVITNVSVHDTEQFGILIGGTGCQVSHCLVSDSSVGFFVWNGYDNKIGSNSIIHNTHGFFCISGSNNYIHHNNFIDNTFNANTSDQNRWDANYWDDWIGLRIEALHFLPYHATTTDSQNFVRTFLSGFDWHPAQEPYDIGGNI